MFRTIQIALAFSLVSLATPALAQNKPSQIVVGGGISGLRDDSSGVGSIEYRFGREFGFVSPLVGMNITTDGAFYAHAGLYKDLELGARWTLTPHLSVGGYARGSGDDLGHALEFQSGLDLMYRLESNWRMGLTIRHLSNASISDHNPGVERVMFLLSIPTR